MPWCKIDSIFYGLWYKDDQLLHKIQILVGNCFLLKNYFLHNHNILVRMITVIQLFKNTTLSSVVSVMSVELQTHMFPSVHCCAALMQQNHHRLCARVRPLSPEGNCSYTVSCRDWRQVWVKAQVTVHHHTTSQLHSFLYRQSLIIKTNLKHSASWTDARHQVAMQLLHSEWEYVSTLNQLYDQYRTPPAHHMAVEP